MSLQIQLFGSLYGNKIIFVFVLCKYFVTVGCLNSCQLDNVFRSDWEAVYIRNWHEFRQSTVTKLPVFRNRVSVSKGPLARYAKLPEGWSETHLNFGEITQSFNMPLLFFLQRKKYLELIQKSLKISQQTSQDKICTFAFKMGARTNTCTFAPTVMEQSWVIKKPSTSAFTRLRQFYTSHLMLIVQNEDRNQFWLVQ